MQLYVLYVKVLYCDQSRYNGRNLCHLPFNLVMVMEQRGVGFPTRIIVREEISIFWF